jgi:hypothetical protein
VKKLYLDEGDELGLPWDRWADGLPHRLKRKRDFGDIDPELVREAAKNAAKRMGKAVQALPDRMTHTSASKYVWIQFADHEIRIGEPCKCGGRQLMRYHPFFARCTRCDAQLLLAPKTAAGSEAIESTDDDEDPDEQLRPDELLRELDDVHLARLERSGDRETYRGYARLGETPVLVIAQFRARPGEALAAEQVFDRVAAVEALPLRQLAGLLDTSVLMHPTTAWDLVL